MNEERKGNETEMKWKREDDLRDARKKLQGVLQHSGSRCQRRSCVELAAAGCSAQAWWLAHRGSAPVAGWRLSSDLRW